MSSYDDTQLLVELHNIINLPKELAVGSTKVFTVVLSCASATPSSSTPDVASTFNTSIDVVVNDRLEAKFAAKSEWSLSNSPQIEVVATVYENTNGLPGDKGNALATSTPLVIDVREIVDFKKISTRFIGTTMGQIGVSFSVSPTDVDGYTRRLENFLRQYNPESVKLVPDIVKSHSEVETFTKIYNKYKIVDYDRRFVDFFRLYGEYELPNIDKYRAQWVNREEELMRNLVLENGGPEPADIDLKKRLAAFAERYDIRNLDVDAIAASGRTPQEVMTALVSDGRPEPDPRTYCFPTVFYSPAQVAPPSRGPSPAYGGGGPNANSASVGPTPSARPPLPFGSSGNNGGMANGNQTPYNNGSNNPYGGGSNNTFSNQNSSSAFQQPYGHQQASPFTGASNLLNGGNVYNAVVMSAAPSGASPQLVELWSKLCEDLRSTGVPLSDLHYINEGSFEAMLIQLGYPPHTRAQLSSEWLRRCRSCVRQETLSAGDSLYEAARRDILTIGNLLPLNVSVVGVVSVKNSEHEASFSLRLGDAKVRATERMLLIGDYTKLLSIAAHGVCPSGQRTGPASVFYRNPLAVYHRPTSVSILVCDVVVGKPQVIPEITSTPYDASEPFLREYDSCVFTDPVYGRAVAVYSPQQVLPRYIVHANVDNSITPCPANPERPVEYLVVENNAFACSQCVVMGQYRGKEVIPIDEAATQARTQLSEMHRDADALVHELNTEEEVCAKTIDSINKGDIRLNAAKIAEQIRRDAEQRIQQLMIEAEDLERTQLQSVSQQKQRVHTVLVDAQQTSQMLHEKSTRSATSAIEALLQLRVNNPVAPIRQRAQVVLAQQAAVHELNNNNAAGLVGFFNAAGGNNTTNANASMMNNTTYQQQQQQQSVARNHGSGGGNTTTLNNTTVANNNGPVFDTNGITGRYAPSVGNNTNMNRASSTSMADNRAASLFRNNGGGAASGSVSMNPAANSSNQVVNGDLFSKYMSLKNEQSKMNNTNNNNTNAMMLNASNINPNATTMNVNNNTNQSALAGRAVSVGGGAGAPLPATAEAKFNKEQLTKGWSEHRKGDRAAALSTWLAVYERNANNSTGARAKAYIAEAIERDYDGAARWYEKAIAIDPSDVMSLYNYGVLLDSVMNRKREAMQMFETAYRYGDQTAGKRAQQLRVQLGL